MGMRSNLFQSVGSFMSPTSRSKAHVLANRSKYGIAGKGANRKVATQKFQNAIATRQREVGRRTVGAAGAAGAGGSLAMYKNRDGSRGGYRPPSTRTARGTGRYA